ncbi:uncharacterized protein LOC124404175 [Diprion similis]|uniref:uncharacterized protein LOC124404175 n=1 Tax=Diprion similis TaxID=362088 RepID=UPI001EF8A883|nr:uncharacterized protein LOC124404175 [Diprion similis]XP_046734066.1 uncharacterized protein LOC124404175 [Diprion similis]
MTRKCVLCKGTNYKRTFSFFSAPKDLETRKKWQQVIPIADYTVTDDTYICSKHFKPSDIITHWVSGVPPHVVRIKYKKFRLRVGAVPCLSIKENDDSGNMLIPDQSGLHDKLISDEVDFLIPRKNYKESVSINSHVNESSFNYSNEANFEKSNIIDQRHVLFSQLERIDDYINENRIHSSDDGHIQKSADSIKDTECGQTDNYFMFDYKHVYKDKSETSIIVDKLQEKNENSKRNLMAHCIQLEQNKEVVKEELIIEDSLKFYNEHHTDDDCVKDDNKTERRREIEACFVTETLKFPVDKECSDKMSNSVLNETMLFEDFLEIYTEVTLPRGWSFLVTSKGHATTVVYLYMNFSMNHTPVVNKTVHIRSDMIMHCSVSSRKINPFLHNLVRNGKSNKVYTLSDIEELVDELDQRHICEGGPNVQDFGDIRMGIAFMDTVKWRHMECPLIMNNESSQCSKCASLNVAFAQRKNREPVYNMLLNKQKEIEKLRRSLKKITRHNRRLDEIRFNFKNRLKSLLTGSKQNIGGRIIPKIQELMIQERLRSNLVRS